MSDEHAISCVVCNALSVPRRCCAWWFGAFAVGMLMHALNQLAAVVDVHIMMHFMMHSSDHSSLQGSAGCAWSFHVSVESLVICVAVGTC